MPYPFKSLAETLKDSTWIIPGRCQGLGSSEKAWKFRIFCTTKIGREPGSPFGFFEVCWPTSKYIYIYREAIEWELTKGNLWKFKGKTVEHFYPPITKPQGATVDSCARHLWCKNLINNGEKLPISWCRICEPSTVCPLWQFRSLFVDFWYSLEVWNWTKLLIGQP